MKKLVLGICLIISSLLSAQMNSQVADSKSSDMKVNTANKESDIWTVFQNRRSVRNFKPDSIPQKDILKIIDAARMAPTSGNQQPWKFLVVRDKNKITLMKEACINGSLDRFDKNGNKTETRDQFRERVTRGFQGYFSAPVYIIILTDNKSMYPDYNHWDGPLAAGYLMLAARALGYGTVFITDAIPDNVTKEVLQIPDNYTRVCITPLGVPVEWPKTPEKKKLEEMISYEKLSN
jgi:nitroreductase